MLETPRQFAIVAGNDRHFSGLREGRQADLGGIIPQEITEIFALQFHALHRHEFEETTP
jgi:hypothetical protein